MFRKALLTILLLSIGWITAAQANRVPESVQKVIRTHKIPGNAISILVQDVNSNTPLLRVNADVPYNPASVIKLVTTFVALDILGPSYTWLTKLYALGPIKNGVLHGDLVLKGSGNPYLTIEEFWKMLGRLHKRGIDTIHGDLVIDDSHFIIADIDPGAFDREPYQPYNVVPNAMLVNFKSVEFRFNPGDERENIRITMQPELPNLKVTNRVRIKKAPCKGSHLNIKMDIPDRITADHVVFSGEFPSACRSYSLYRSVLQPESYAFGAFQQLWGHWGGTITGGPRKGLSPTKARPLIISHSPPLAEIIRATNKWSNNVMSRLLLYTLATAKFNPPVTKEQGIEVIRDYLRENNLDDSLLTLDNGSGLSRTTRATADLINSLLRHAYRDPYMPEFIASMPINGIDGTMRRRLQTRPEQGRMHLKTGRLDDVATIAGYVLARSGTTYSVVVLLNHDDVHKRPGVEIQNAVLQWVHDK
ncbi:MAG TPA: D-alanyl-D-alanine carboxypeptidase/D-alanyl-D-alanine-endopeptidase [Gammaproteobacteria bacterium]|nr:D-alanyl-D-alanine carboxypeptidase/D-alanyl-D-alanine-endopeptidase [Gammaproteobacteria bacterium]